MIAYFALLSFVPLLLIAPLPYVPLLFAAAGMLAAAPDIARNSWHPHRWLDTFSDSWAALGGVIVLATLALCAAGCSSDSGGGNTLSEAFCDDLRAGLTPYQILGPSVRDGTYTPSEAADRAYGFAAISCPYELKTNEALRSYLQNWNIDPDA